MSSIQGITPSKASELELNFAPAAATKEVAKAEPAKKSQKKVILKDVPKNTDLSSLSLAELEKMSKDMLMQVLQLLAEVQIIQSRMQAKSNENQVDVSKVTVAATKATAAKLIKKVEEAMAEEKKAEHLHHILGIFSKVFEAMSVIMGAILGAGALMAAVEMVALNESGAMKKISGDSLGAKIGLSLAIGLGTGLIAGATDAAFFSAEEAAENAAEEAVEAAPEKAINSSKDAFKAGFRFGSINSTVASLALTGALQTVLSHGSKKSGWQYFGMLSSMLVMISAALAAGGGGSNTSAISQVFGNSSQVASKEALMVKSLTYLMLVPTIMQGVYQFLAGKNSMKQSDTANAMAPLKAGMVNLHYVTQLIQQLQSQSSSEVKADAKRFEADMKNFNALALPWAAAARAINSAA